MSQGIWPNRKVVTLERAGKGTFEVYKLAFVLRCLDFIGGKILVHPKVSDIDTIG
jgi:hypothetical protein